MIPCLPRKHIKVSHDKVLCLFGCIHVYMNTCIRAYMYVYDGDGEKIEVSWGDGEKIEVS